MIQAHASTLHSERNKPASRTKDRAIVEEKSCSSESEAENKLEENPHSIEHACKSANTCSDNSTPEMKLFNDLSDIASAVERLHHEILRFLTTNESCIECKYLLQSERKVSYVIVPYGTSRASDWTRSQVIKTSDSITATYAEVNGAFFDSLLSMIESKHDDPFFNFSAKNDIARKQAAP